jgi:hypothetical protein
MESEDLDPHCPCLGSSGDGMVESLGYSWIFGEELIMISNYKKL